jgi:cytochrome c
MPKRNEDLSAGSLSTNSLMKKRNPKEDDMKRLMLVAVVAATIFVCGAGAAHAQSQREQAQAMVDKAVAYIKANGKDKAIAEFNNPAGRFIKGEIFIFVQGFDGMVLAHGGNSKLVGINMLDSKDATGKLFVREMIETAKTKGNGWVSYSWTNPVTKKVQRKESYVVKVDDYCVGCGVYK